jgi:hypothetical protein
MSIIPAVEKTCSKSAVVFSRFCTLTILDSSEQMFSGIEVELVFHTCSLKLAYSQRELYLSCQLRSIKALADLLQ